MFTKFKSSQKKEGDHLDLFDHSNHDPLPWQSVRLALDEHSLALFSPIPAGHLCVVCAG
jgi:hypothetical protein